MIPALAQHNWLSAARLLVALKSQPIPAASLPACQRSHRLNPPQQPPLLSLATVGRRWRTLAARLLLASAALVLSVPTLAQAGVHHAQAVEQLAVADAARAIVFVDATVPQHELLLKGIDPSSAEVVRLDPLRDGVAQMAQALAGRSGLDAIHIISHGAPGRLMLGSSVLDAGSMQAQHRQALQNLGAALRDGGDILVYGCDFASGLAGEQASRLLADLTGADVAASSTPIGHAALGGNWLLDSRIGQLDAPVIVGLQAQNQWQHTLASIVNGDFSNGTTGWTLSGNVGADVETAVSAGGGLMDWIAK